MTRFPSFIISLAVAALAAGCTQNETAGQLDAGTSSQDGGGDAAVMPPTAACEGDPMLCLSGTMTMKGFTATYQTGKVELYRVFPNGAVKPVDSHIIAKDGKFAFSSLPAWSHYYLRGVVRIGDATTGASVTTMRGRFTVPIGASNPGFDLTVIPVQLEILETIVGTDRKLQFASAHVYDPATGHDLTDATVSFQGTASPTPLPYVANSSGAKSYFVLFSPAVAATPPYTFTTSHAALGAMPLTWSVASETSTFGAALTAPMEGATVPANQALDVTWPTQAAADYTLVELFAKQGTAFTSKYTSSASIASDVTKETIPATSVATPGSYLLNVDLGQALCQLGTSQGCAYLVHPATANLTVQ